MFGPRLTVGAPCACRLAGGSAWACTAELHGESWDVTLYHVAGGAKLAVCVHGLDRCAGGSLTRLPRIHEFVVLCITLGPLSEM